MVLLPYAWSMHRSSAVRSTGRSKAIDRVAPCKEIAQLLCNKNYNTTCLVFDETLPIILLFHSLSCSSSRSSSRSSSSSSSSRSSRHDQAYYVLFPPPASTEQGTAPQSLPACGNGPHCVPDRLVQSEVLRAIMYGSGLVDSTCRPHSSWSLLYTKMTGTMKGPSIISSPPSPEAEIDLSDLAKNLNPQHPIHGYHSLLTFIP
jgi:hypothetical protein